MVEVEESSEALRLGLRADVAIVTRTLDNALVIPRMALIKDASTGDMLVDVDSGSGSQRRTVTVVAQDEVDACVEGVNEGDRADFAEPQAVCARRSQSAGGAGALNGS